MLLFAYRTYNRIGGERRDVFLSFLDRLKLNTLEFERIVFDSLVIPKAMEERILDNGEEREIFENRSINFTAGRRFYTRVVALLKQDR